MLSYIFAFVLGFIFCKYHVPIRQKGFAWFMNMMTSKANPEYSAWKATQLAELKTMKSYFPSMQEKKSIKILEVGVGTGANFKFFPDKCHLTVVDPNPNFREYYNTNRAKYPQIETEEIIVAKGEEMTMVEDNSVDAVVVTWVMCSCEDLDQFLAQIHRVLAPGGKFFFIEHIKEWDSEKNGTRYYLQELLTCSRIWPSLFDGCELNRPMLPNIEKAGFSKVDCDKVYPPGASPALFIGSHLAGVATK